MQCSSHSPTFISQSLSTGQAVVKMITVAAASNAAPNDASNADPNDASNDLSCTTSTNAVTMILPKKTSTSSTLLYATIMIITILSAVCLIVGHPCLKNKGVERWGQGRSNSSSAEPTEEKLVDRLQFSKQGVAKVDDLIYKKIREDVGSTSEFKRTNHWFRAFGNGEVEIVQVVDSNSEDAGPHVCMKMPYLGKDLSDCIKTWKGDIKSSDQIPAYTLLKDIIQKLTNIFTNMSQKRNDGFYHGDIKPGNIVVSKEGVPHIIDFTNGYLPDEAKVTSPTITVLYAPADVRNYVKCNHPCYLDPTVDELAFVRTVYEMVHPERGWGFTLFPWTLIHPEHTSETSLSHFCFEVQKRLDDSLKYGSNNLLETNRNAVKEAIEQIYPNKEFEDGVTVYDVVNTILKEDNWNQEPLAT